MCDFKLPIVLFILSLIFFGVYRFIKQETCRHENRTRVDNGPWGASLGTFKCKDCGKTFYPIME